jgi:hypothetical protein
VGVEGLVSSDNPESQAGGSIATNMTGQEGRNQTKRDTKRKETSLKIPLMTETASSVTA